MMLIADPFVSELVGTLPYTVLDLVPKPVINSLINVYGGFFNLALIGMKYLTIF